MVSFSLTPLGGTDMSNSDLLVNYEQRYKAYRLAMIFIASISIPLNACAMYVVLWKSPPQLAVYKYILFNILVWIFVTDVVLGIFFIPVPICEIYAGLATGIAQYFGPEVGFSCVVIHIFCMYESFVAILFGFVYRYIAIKQGPHFIAKSIRTVYFWVTILTAMIIPPGTTAFLTTLSYVEPSNFKETVSKSFKYSKSDLQRLPCFSMIATGMPAFSAPENPFFDCGASKGRGNFNTPVADTTKRT
ncbi:hypothetical protein QR680_015590 [Steinernema hermaphroditum]|uniref:Uncharacterized protein n=1 Tax=Steinernema hermaphroditum TaxID=289476 RepID=A0AA39H8B0_9BILA|nr:hypothetical protein QR680_015590 [Steinernema hermaphroditum]